MKTKFLSQKTILLFLIVLVSCQSEEPNPNTFPEIGETSGNYIAFKFDGNEYVTESHSSFWTSPKDDPYRGTYISENGKRFTGSSYQTYDTIKGGPNFFISLQNNPIVNVPIALVSDNSDNSVETPTGGNLKFSYETTTGYVIDTLFSEVNSRKYTVGVGSSWIFKTNDIQRGEITFTFIDTVSQIYQGTFWADVKYHKFEPRFSLIQPYPNFTDYWNLVALRTNIDTERVIRIRDGRFYCNPAKPDLRHRAEL